MALILTFSSSLIIPCLYIIGIPRGVCVF